MLITAAEQFVSSNIWHGILIFVLVSVTWGVIKRFTGMVNEWVSIHTDNFGIGTSVYHNKEKFVIRRISFRRIELYNMQSGERKYVNTSEWINFEVVLPDIPSKPKEE